MNALRCRHCGREILSSQLETRYDMNGGEASCRLRCGCGASTPWGEYCKDREKAIEAAYVAATATPPNLPLTKTELYYIPDIDPVWRVDKHGNSKVFDGFTAWSNYNDKLFLYFASKPTPADIAAAKAGREQGE